MEHVAMNTLIWEAAVVLWIIGFVEMGIGKNKPRDFGWVLVTGGLMETIALAFLIAAGDMFGATAAAAFILLLWILGAPLVMNEEPSQIQTHAMWFTGFYFLCAAIFLGSHGLIWLTVAFGLLVPLLWFLAIATYTGKHGFAKVAGLISAVDGIIFFIIAFSTSIGVHLG